MFNCVLPPCPECGGKHVGIVQDSIRNLTIYKLCCINDSCINPETSWELSLDDLIQEWTNKGKENMTPKKVIRLLCDNGFKAYIVGGAVRDMLEGVSCNDIDIATNATPEQVIKLFPEGKAQKAGNRFAVVFVNDIQIATFRKDTQVEFYSRKKIEVEYADTIEEDLNRRDLTINAIATCPVTGDIVDIHGGALDLKNKIIRMVGNPVDRIMQDPTRILRACRFLAKLQGRFDNETLLAIQKYHSLVKDHVEKEMIRYEFLRAMELKVPSLFFSALHLTGVLKHLLPEMVDAYEFPHGEHHLENVWEHLMLTGDGLTPRDPLLRLAGFLHDIGKPMAYHYCRDGSFCGHEMVGKNIVLSRLPQLGFSENETKKVANLVEAHMRTCLSLSPRGQRRLRKYLEDSNIDPRAYLRLKIADRSANLLRSPTEIAPVKGFLKAVGLRGKEVIPFTVLDLALSGGELIDLFNLPRGPIVGELQRYLLNLVIDSPELNTKAALYEEAEKKLASY